MLLLSLSLLLLKVSLARDLRNPLQDGINRNKYDSKMLFKIICLAREIDDPVSGRIPMRAPEAAMQERRGVLALSMQRMTRIKGRMNIR